VIRMVNKDEYDWPTSTVTNFGLRVLHGLQSGEKSMRQLMDISGATYQPSQFESAIMSDLINDGLVRETASRTYEVTDKGSWYLELMLNHRDIDVLDARNKISVSNSYDDLVG